MAMTPAERAKAHRERAAQRETAEETAVANAIELARLRTENQQLKERLARAESLLDRALENVTNRDGPPRNENRHDRVTRDVTAGGSSAVPRLARGSTDLSSVASSLHDSPDQRESESTLSRDGEVRNENRHDRVTRDVTLEHVMAAILAAVDLWPDLAPEAVAKRIVQAVENEPAACRDGVTAAIATAEGVVHARAHLAKFPAATPETLVAEMERHIVKHILGDCRRGTRKVVRDEPSATNGGGPRKPWSQMTSQERDDRLAEENASRPKKAIEY
jgi:hypothetical protein